MEWTGHKLPVQTVSGGILRLGLSSISCVKRGLFAEKVNFLLCKTSAESPWMYLPGEQGGEQTAWVKKSCS